MICAFIDADNTMWLRTLTEYCTAVRRKSIGRAARSHFSPYRFPIDF
jgi:hypothetical protein